MAVIHRVVKDPTVLKMTADPDGTATEVDLCAYVRAVNIAPSVEQISTNTFCQTSTQLGSPEFAITLAFLWSPEAYAALDPHIGAECEFVMQDAEDVTAGKAVVWRGKYAHNIWGTFEIGSRVESDLPLATLVAPAYSDYTPPVAAAGKPKSGK